MSEHYAVVRQDAGWLKRLAELRPLTDDDRKGAWSCYIECSDPANCPGWMECGKEHPGMDPEDEDSPAYDGDLEDVMIHGEFHTWRSGHGWTVESDGCPVEFNGNYDTPDRVALDGPHRYLLDVDWDDDICYLSVVREIDLTETKETQ